MGVFEFILGIVLIGAIYGVIKTAIRVTFGYPLTDEKGNVIARQDSQETRLLMDENAALKTQIGRLEERVRVLEQIATDPAERTAREIDSLR